MSEEIFSSFCVDTLVSFVGFQPDIIIPYFRPYLNSQGNCLDRIVLFTSKFDEVNPDQDSLKASIVLENVLTYINERNSNLQVEINRLSNIWDLRMYIKHFEQIISKKASVNLTSGPSVYSIAGLLWAIKNNHLVEHSIEANSSLYGRSVVFKRIEMTPYFNLLFKTDKIDKEIIQILKNGQSNTRAIRSFLNNELKENLTLRTVENRVNKLVELQILGMVRGRQNIIFLNDNLIDIL
ncbi:hypothetical protein ACNF42_02665 [Cuniculiplasma sp. SKW3]|uniref:hypothetical protein n=1 Tax=Cuniculiplasma sp. SKW3 TaxID=3400170 RepID=UPI003FD063C9